MKCDVISLDNKKVGNIDLDEAVFGVDVRADILSRAVNWQLARRRSGDHKTKERSEINGTTAKPFKQKGTGSARQGDKKAPHMRGGGVAFGPRVRDHSHKLQKKVRVLALKIALSAKRADGKLVIIDEAKMKEPKTRELTKRLGKLGWRTALIIDGRETDGNFMLASANVPGLDVLPSQGANVYDILRRDILVLTKDGVARLVERLK